MLKEGDILMSLTGNVGRVALLTADLLPAALNQRVACLRLKDESIYKKFLFHYLNSSSFENSCTKESKGVAQKNLSTEWLKKQKIPYFQLQKQKEISKVLDKITDIINKKQEQISKYDELIKSQFIEIFGDIFTNDKCFKIGLFKDFVAKINIGPFGSSLKKEYFVSKEDSYCMVYEQKHAIEKNIEIERRYVNYSKYKELSRFEVSPGDIIVSCRGTIGKCHLLPTDAPIGIIHPSLMMIKPKDNTNPNFLLFLLERILERQFESGSGVKMAIKAKDLSKIKTISPDKNIQDKYIFFVKKIDRLKSIARQSLNETQKLFDSLMQEYFG
jgi:type I restriction enzyme S subunit